MKKKILVATHNQGKVAEYRELLADMALEFVSLDDAGVTFDVAETGDTFRDNALLKATAYARTTSLLTLADDSGLQVDALNGAPGVQTARYGGAGLTHAGRYSLLLENLKGVPWSQRTARFRAVIVLVDAEGALLAEAEGVCEGMIALEPAGDGGFGYDPVFYLPDRQQTMAQLPSAEKHAISHRGRALQQLLPLLREM